MNETPPPASIALANGVVVRVGDTASTRSGDTAAIEKIDDHPHWPLVGVIAGRQGLRGMSWSRTGHAYNVAKPDRDDIDIAALASSPDARQRSGVAEVVDAARELIDELNKPFVVGIDNMAGTKKAIRRTQRALAALDQEARDG